MRDGAVSALSSSLVTPIKFHRTTIRRCACLFSASLIRLSSSVRQSSRAKRGSPTTARQGAESPQLARLEPASAQGMPTPGTRLTFQSSRALKPAGAGLACSCGCSGHVTAQFLAGSRTMWPSAELTPAKGHGVSTSTDQTSSARR